MTIDQAKNNIEKVLMENTATQGLAVAACLLESWAMIKNELAEKQEDKTTIHT
jgi:hypothetical protein